MKMLVLERLEALKQSDEPQKDTLYYVQLDTNEVLWIREGDIVDLACELDNPQNAVELMEWFIRFNILVEIPNVFHEDVNELIRQNRMEQQIMNKTVEYIGYETRGIDSYYYPIVRIDGKEIGVHCVKSWDMTNTKNFKHVVYELSDIILQRLTDESNYGLCFYACGYNGAAQTDFEQHYMDNYGIELW